MAELIINGREALKEWGVRMGDNFLDVLGAPVPLKEFIGPEKQRHAAR